MSGVILLAPDYPPTVGGIERYMEDLYHALSAWGPIHVLAGWPTQAGPPPSRPDGVPAWVPRPPGAAGALPFLLRMMRVALRTARRTGAREYLSGHIVLAPVGEVLKARHGGRTTVITHAAEITAGRLLAGKRAFLRKADRVVVVSEYTRGLVMSAGVHPLHIRRLSPGIHPSPDPAPDARAQARARLGIPTEIPVLLTVARLSYRDRYKGHDVMVAALPRILARHPDLLWLIVGDGDNRSRIEARAGRVGVADHIRFMGRLTENEIRSTYDACDLFCLISREGRDRGAVIAEGFGIVYTEAGDRARPVVGGRSGGVPSAVDHGRTGLLVDPREPGEVAEAILSLLGDPARAAAMGRAGRTRVLEEFAWSHTVAPLAAEIYGRRPPPEGTCATVPSKVPAEVPPPCA